MRFPCNLCWESLTDLRWIDKPKQRPRQDPASGRGASVESWLHLSVSLPLSADDPGWRQRSGQDLPSGSVRPGQVPPGVLHCHRRHRFHSRSSPPPPRAPAPSPPPAAPRVLLTSPERCHCDELFVLIRQLSRSSLPLPPLMWHRAAARGAHVRVRLSPWLLMMMMML